MSDYDLPDLPSDEDLGLTEEEIKELEAEFADTGPEMTAEEMAALLGEEPPAPAPAPPSKSGTEPPGGDATAAAPSREEGPSKKELRAAERARKKAAKEAAKATRARKKAEQRAAKAARDESGQEKKSALGQPTGQAKGQPTGQPTAEKTTPSDEEVDGSKRGTPTPIDEGSRSKWRGPATAALLIAACVFASSRTGVPRPVPANAGETQFSSARAMVTLVEIAREAHPPGSPEHARVRAYLVDRLRALGLEPEVQTTTSLVEHGPSVVWSATVRNVVARVPGTASTGAVLITAHYDSRGIALGAADDGAGVVAILEALRAVLASGPLQNDVIVLFTDAEELDLLGARAFVDEHTWMADVRVALSIEMRGAGGPSIMFETGDQNGWIVRALQAADPTAYGNSMSYEIYQRMPNNTDFTPFEEAGVQGLNFAAIDNAHVYHQVYDSPENLSESTLQHHGEHALNALRYLGNQDLTAVDAANVTYFNVPGFGFFAYDARWILPISGALLVLFVLASLLTRSVTGGFVGTSIGAGISIAGAALSYAAATQLARWLPGFHPELDSLDGSAYHSEGWYVLALAGATVAIVTTLHGIARRWVHLNSLALGSAIVPLGAAAWLSYSMPLAAMNLQWPVAAALSAIILLGVLRKNALSVVGWTIAVLMALPVLAFLEPITELLWIALTFRLAGILAVLMAVTVYLCLPAIDGLRHPNAWWAPVASLAVGAAALGIGILTSRAAPDRPSPSTLVYALDHSSQEALWVTDPLENPAHTAARAWAVAQAGSTFDSVRDLRAFAYPYGEVPVTDAELVEVQEPEIFTEYDEPVDGKRRALMSVRSRLGAEVLGFQYADGSGTRLLSINGRPVSDPGSIRWAYHAGEPDPVVLLELEVPEQETLELNIVEHTLRPGEILGVGVFERPETLAPDVSRMSDRAMLLTRFAAQAQPVAQGDGGTQGTRFELRQLLDSIVGAYGRGGAEDVNAGPPVAGTGADASRSDTVESIADSTSSQAPPGADEDTSGVVPDSGMTPPDTSRVRPDTSFTTGATTSRQADTITGRVDTIIARVDTTTGRVDTTTGRVDTTTGGAGTSNGRGNGNGAVAGSDPARRL